MQSDNEAMARPCGICNHMNRSEIELGLESGQSIRVVAARFGISRSALHRHGTSHVLGVGSQTSEPVHQQKQPTQNLCVTAIVPVVLSSPPPVPAPRGPEWSNRLTTVSEPPKPQKDIAGPPGPCPVCFSKSWRLLPDGTVSCAVCHPMPPSGAFVHTGHANERRGAATPIIAISRPLTRSRVPTALSSL